MFFGFQGDDWDKLVLWVFHLNFHLFCLKFMNSSMKFKQKLGLGNDSVVFIFYLRDYTLKVPIFY
jgi:hypothetical protein